jgi:hypothetical protein
VNAVAARRAVQTPAGRAAASAFEALAAIAVATAAVVVLNGLTSADNLRVIYLLAVLFVTIRRDETAAIATAIGSVLALNFFFVEPRHQLRISHSEDVVALAVFLVAALVVGRLATTARERAVQAEAASACAVREQEARRSPAWPRRCSAASTSARPSPRDTDDDGRPLIRAELRPCPRARPTNTRCACPPRTAPAGCTCAGT